MRQVKVALATCAVLLVGWITAEACGDKFLVIGHGKRSYRAVHPASILLYMKPGSGIAAAARELKLQTNLKQAGHRFDTVAEPARMDEALKSRSYDLILADLEDVHALTEETRTLSRSPAIVPVIYKPSPGILRSAEERYRCVVTAPAEGQGQSFLVVIDDAMELRLEGVTAKGQ
jgi:hypothetical protein